MRPATSFRIESQERDDPVLTTAAGRQTVDWPSGQATQVVSIPDPTAAKRSAMVIGKYSAIKKGKDRKQWQDKKKRKTGAGQPDRTPSS
ncbi:hypothetical protein R1flu_010185 [Riccia fluitans]|uniref:Uncharacterized protein n=1 Tax=Riccia fluitans TaxID=41844 RepID=A0ABD1Z493_9MARC